MREAASLVAVLLTLVTLTARAQPRTDGPPPSPVDAALEAFGNHDYAAALALFRQAYELTPVDQIRFNMARCLERMARFREAAHEYAAAAESPQLTEDQRARAREALDEVRARLGALELTGPTGITVRIDEQLACVLPCRERLDPGEHRLSDDSGAERTFRVARGETARLRWVPRPPAPELTAPPEPGHTLGALTAAGAITAGVGAIAIVVFGLLVEQQLSDFDAAPSHAIADRGEVFAGLANASIGVTALGGALVLLDLMLLAF